MKLTKKEVEHMAKLARIKLTLKEKEKYARELTKILDYIEQLKQVDTRDIEGLANITGLYNVMDQDKSQSFENPENLLKQAPERKGKYIKTKAIIE